MSFEHKCFDHKLVTIDILIVEMSAETIRQDKGAFSITYDKSVFPKQNIFRKKSDNSQMQDTDAFMCNFPKFTFVERKGKLNQSDYATFCSSSAPGAAVLTMWGVQIGDTLPHAEPNVCDLCTSTGVIS